MQPGTDQVRPNETERRDRDIASYPDRSFHQLRRRDRDIAPYPDRSFHQLRRRDRDIAPYPDRSFHQLRRRDRDIAYRDEILARDPTARSGHRPTRTDLSHQLRRRDRDIAPYPDHSFHQLRRRNRDIALPALSRRQRRTNAGNRRAA